MKHQSIQYRMALHLFTSRVNHDMENIRELVDITENHLISETKRLGELVDKELENTPEDEKEFVIGWYTDDFVRLDRIYPNLQRRALFTTLMGMLETDLLLGCRMCRRAFGISKEFKKKGNQRIIVQAMGYLRSNLTIREKSIQYQWELVQNLWTIRNAFVHDDGKLRPLELNDISEFCKPIPSLEIDHHNRIILNEGSVQMAIHSVNQLFLQLIEELKRNKLVQQIN